MEPPESSHKNLWKHSEWFVLWKLLLYIRIFITWNRRTYILYWARFLGQCLHSEEVICNLIKTNVFCLLHRLMRKEHRRMFFWKSAGQLTLFWKRRRQHFPFQQKRSNGSCTAWPHVHLRVVTKMLFKAILLAWEYLEFVHVVCYFRWNLSSLFWQYTQQRVSGPCAKSTLRRVYCFTGWLLFPGSKQHGERRAALVCTSPAHTFDGSRSARPAPSSSTTPLTI